ncbi:putative protein kinase [Trypanosoma theileri]|uniref:non-specific serine/threonine protein kinase n=1 Tax=Trypanosoma theileri TaxID=67003 RepID=A0A1X0NP43_9TRYP|nr:putative protein kinase [Trypanosoma theileri]ORC86486.1 putative protein kinase [Trypanosoma theileri]
MNALDELNFRLGIGPSRPRLPITLQRSGYTPVRLLGKGSFGNAYLVYHAERKEHYVVKHVNMSSMTARQRKDAHQEIAVLQQLEYPNIIRYVEFYEEHPHLYIVMEYADGGDVYTHLKHLRSSVWALGSGGSGGLTEEQVISLFVQTTMAVKYMHDRRLLHRDIKSQNVFLTHNHVVKLGDFGISTVLMSTVAMAQTMCGTPCYFSPELCQGKPYNNKSDVWALGILLYELCTTGRLPFEATTMNRLMDDICHKEPRRIPSSFSEELWNLVQWMLKKDPRQRPDAGQILRSPVLVRAIPDVVKKLSATDPRCEVEYSRLLGSDAKPLPPVRPGVELQNQLSHQHQHQKQEDGKEHGRAGMFPSSGLVAAVVAAGAKRHDLFRKPNDEYPFSRGDAVGNGRQGLELNRPVKPPPSPSPLLREQKKKEEKEYGLAPLKAPLAGEGAGGGQAAEGGESKYNPILLQGKVNYFKGKDVGVKNDHRESPYGLNEPRENVVDKNLKEKKDAVTSAVNKEQKSQQDPQKRSPPKKPIAKVALQDLFLLYDEKKKRIIQEREQRSNVRNPMNYQPKDAISFRGKSAEAAAVPIDAERSELSENVQRQNSPQPPTPPPRRKLSDVLEEKANEEVTKKEKDINPSLTPASQNETVEKMIGEDADKKGNVESQNELAFVLRELTNHFESVHSSMARSQSGRSSPGMNATPRRHISETGSNEDDNNNNNRSPSTPSQGIGEGEEKDILGNADYDDYNVHDEDPGQEFADAMGTTLDLKSLQRSPTSPGAIPVESDGNAMQERIPLNIARYAAVSPARSQAIPSLSASGRQGRDALRNMDEKNNNNNNNNKGEVQTDGVSLMKEQPTSSPSQGVIPGEEYAVDGLMEEYGPPFNGGCLCDGVQFNGDASTIYGSFVCNCVVCSRFSGAMMGVEWLHLPDVSLEAFFSTLTEIQGEETPAAAAKLNDVTPAGAGVVAAQALAKASTPSAARRNEAAATAAVVVGKSEEKGKEGKDVAVLMPSLTRLVLEVPVASGGNTDGNDDSNNNNNNNNNKNDDDNKDVTGVQVMGEFTVYFCSRCGCTIGMTHYDIEGGLLAKAALSDVSLAVLESFQQTVGQTTM